MLKTRVFVEVRATNLTERYFAQFEIMNSVIHYKVVYDIRYKLSPGEKGATNKNDVLGILVTVLMLSRMKVL